MTPPGKRPRSLALHCTSQLHFRNGKVFLEASQQSMDIWYVEKRKRERKRVNYELIVTNDKVVLHLCHECATKKIWLSFVKIGNEAFDLLVKESRCEVCQHSQKKFSKPTSKLHPMAVVQDQYRVAADRHRPGWPLTRDVPWKQVHHHLHGLFHQMPETTELQSESAEGALQSN